MHDCVQYFCCFSRKILNFFNCIYCRGIANQSCNNIILLVHKLIIIIAIEPDKEYKKYTINNTIFSALIFSVNMS
jgi:hypothetical protein